MYVFANGNLKKITDCKVQPYRVQTEENTFRKEINSDESDEKPKQCQADSGEKEKMEGPKTRSRSKSEREGKNDEFV